mgnify:CR=1 FL=1
MRLQVGAYDGRHVRGMGRLHSKTTWAILILIGRSVVLQRGMGTGTYRKHAATVAVKIAQVRIFISAHHMLQFLAADLVPNCTDPIKFYIDLYGGEAYNHAFVAMRFERPDEAS